VSLIASYSASPIKLRLARDLVRLLKRGHPWVYADALRDHPAAPPGAQALLLDNKKGQEIARGFYDAGSKLAFRACSTEPDEVLNDAWAERRLRRALRLRQFLFDSQTTGFRLFNGEGDGLPGLICDIYGDTAVFQLDGPGPAGFWQMAGLAEWVAQALSLRRVYQRTQSRREGDSRMWLGERPDGPIPFLENSVHFTADIVQGQKTGFFLDQRENRQTIRNVAQDRQVLNVFGYTGGFSVYAGLGGGRTVTTVDIAAPALKAADEHWRINGLAPDQHTSVRSDAFEFLAEAAQKKKTWDLVIVDPPSFAPSKEAVDKAITAYQNLIAAAVTVTAPDGLLAAASCSSHIDLPTFLNICEEAVSKARRRATLLRVNGQPPDHPSPLPLPEFRYLKFVLLRID
jgi:23S rRNA (cytosine1962-C5)-methyltransferase